MDQKTKIGHESEKSEIEETLEQQVDDSVILSLDYIEFVVDTVNKLLRKKSRVNLMKIHMKSQK